MVSPPTISVLMPAYNAQAYLRDAVDSILRQTQQDFELILINDGSTDATAAIAEELSARDARIRYFTQENRGIVATLNRGLELCRGEFIARMDADDIAHPRRFEKQLALLRKDPRVVICGSDASILGRSGGVIRKPRTDAGCRAWLLVGPCFVHPSVMFRRTLVDRGLRYRPDFQYAEDYDFWHRAAALGRMCNIKEPLLAYRFHGGQLTSTKGEIQKRVHVDIALSHLAGQGIHIEPGTFQDILWPEQSSRNALRILLSVGALFMRMALRGHFAPYLMLGTAWNVLRHKPII
jgi:hypothetical protein